MCAYVRERVSICLSKPRRRWPVEPGPHDSQAQDCRPSQPRPIRWSNTWTRSAAGAGFYDYDDGARVGLWPQLVEEFGGDNQAVPFQDMQERMLFAEALESVLCLDEGVLRVGEERLDLQAVEQLLLFTQLRTVAAVLGLTPYTQK